MSSIEVPFTTRTGISVSDTVITDVADPISSQDAATKNFASNASNISGGVLAIPYGGTGSTTASSAINNLFSGVTSITVGAVGASAAAATAAFLGNSAVTAEASYPGNILIQGGTQTRTGGPAGGNVILQGGTNSAGGVTVGGNVILNGGSSSSYPGYIAIQTYAASGILTERLRVLASGAVSFGDGGTNYGTTGQVLTSNGTGVPTWTTLQKEAGGSNTQLQYNSSGILTGSSSLTFNGSNTLSVGSTDTTFSIRGATAQAMGYTGANVILQGGASQNGVGTFGGGSGSLTLAGGDGDATGGSGGDVVIRGGTGPAFAGVVYIRTGNSQTERLRVTAAGAWGLSGANYGTSGQVLTSNGSNSAPTWTTISAAGTVTSVEVSGGTTGLTASGGPITSSGTITLAGTLAATNGGTGQTTWTTGDILYASASNTLSKLAVGSNGQVLTVSSGVPTWAAAGGGGGSSDASTLTGSTLASNVVTSSLTSVGTLSSLTLGGALTFGTNYTETRVSVTASASTTINCSLGNIFSISMGASITTLTFSNVPNSGRVYTLTMFVDQDATGGRTISWPASVRWPSGTAPTLTATGSKTDILSLVTHDGGTSWFGFVAGQNY